MGLAIAARQPDSDLPNGIRESFEASCEVNQELYFADTTNSTAMVSSGSEGGVVTS
jgi:hypothetical protein